MCEIWNTAHCVIVCVRPDGCSCNQGEGVWVERVGRDVEMQQRSAPLDWCATEDSYTHRTVCGGVYTHTHLLVWWSGVLNISLNDLTRAARVHRSGGCDKVLPHFSGAPGPWSWCGQSLHVFILCCSPHHFITLHVLHSKEPEITTHKLFIY